ncbi:MAG: hypothetical protein N2318_07050 [Meiothermus sp.]|nr:hypothetical protein [Meiothermus sp.]
MAEATVQVYGANWCPLTLGFRKYLGLQQIPYHFFDVETDAQAAQVVRAMNGGQLKFPMVVVGELVGYWKPEDPSVVLKNPRLAELEAALWQFGLTKARQP